jgi:hypothetical protein
MRSVTPSAKVPARAEMVGLAAKDQAAAERLFRNLPAKMQVLARRRPVIAGQSPAFYFEILSWCVEEFRPRSLFENVWVKQIADAEHEILLFQEVRTWLFNAAIAADLIAELGDLETDRSDDENQEKTEAYRTVGVSVVRPSRHQGPLRRIRHMAFPAVAGDNDAIAFCEERLGPGAVAIGPQTAEQLERSIPSHLFADRSIKAAFARRDAAYRELQKFKAERWKRMQEKKMTAEDVRASLSLAELVRTKHEDPTVSKSNPETAELSAAGARKLKGPAGDNAKAD